MAFLRFTRDKRGYEQFSLVEAITNRRGKSRSRLLYWYRTPPNVRVGREPFDEAVRRALEAQNPGVQFDWRKIIETPVPSAETEHWRERRRAEKAEKAARRTEVAAGAASQSEDAEEELEEELIAAPDVEAEAEREAAPSLDAVDDSDIDASVEATGDSDRAAQTVPQNTTQAPGPGRRRRRRGRRGRSAPPSSTSPTTTSPATSPTFDDSPAPDSAMNHGGEPRISEPEGD